MRGCFAGRPGKVAWRKWPRKHVGRPDIASQMTGDHWINRMKDEMSVNSGEVKACRKVGILRAGAIGSCVIVAAYAPDSGIGAMAHVMLPGASRDRDPSGKTRYAEAA